MLEKLKKDLLKLGNRQKEKILQRFFKTGKGEYGEGDIFLGITVPEQRKIAKKYSSLLLADIQKILADKIHEFRLVALLILVERFGKGSETEKKEIVNFYLKNTKHINNWDLVDMSADKILGVYFLDKDKSVIYKLAVSENLWKKRIAVLTTFQFIKNYRYNDALQIYGMLISDKHDLIQKAVGWMLRELGKRNLDVELKFLDKYYRILPRTTLRYAIEKFEPEKKNYYMKKK